MDNTAEVELSHSKSDKNKRLTDEDKQSIFQTLLRLSIDGVTEKGSIKHVAASFSISERTVQKIWRQAKLSFRSTGVVDVSRKYQKRVGPKRKEIDFQKVMSIPLKRRTNIRSLAAEMKISKSTLHRRIKEGALKPHSNAIKPHMTDENKQVRLQFCLSMLEPQSLSACPTFKNMFNIVHVDEKWFYMTKECERYYLYPDEEQPLRTCKSKKFIAKVMFLAAVARPRFNYSENQYFDGKIGIFPFVFKEPAKRTSKNRVAGTLETKPILSVTKDVYRRYLIEKVLPAIHSKWPKSDDIGVTEIFIQQDNAKPHIDPTDVDFIEAANRDGFKVQLTFQPPNSPDMNVLDLGYFRAIQSLQHQEAPKTIDDLIFAVEKSFALMSIDCLSNVFLTLQACMVEVMKNLGGNSYKLPHMGKQRLMKDGLLPSQITCEKELVYGVMRHLQG